MVDGQSVSMWSVHPRSVSHVAVMKRSEVGCHLCFCSPARHAHGKHMQRNIAIIVVLAVIISALRPRPIKRKLIKALFLFGRHYAILKALAIRILTTVLAGILMGSPV